MRSRRYLVKVQSGLFAPFKVQLNWHYAGVLNVFYGAYLDLGKCRMKKNGLLACGNDERADFEVFAINCSGQMNQMLLLYHAVAHKYKHVYIRRNLHATRMANERAVGTQAHLHDCHKS